MGIPSLFSEPDYSAQLSNKGRPYLVGYKNLNNEKHQSQSHWIIYLYWSTHKTQTPSNLKLEILCYLTNKSKSLFSGHIEQVFHRIKQ